MTEKQYPELPTHFMLVQESFRDEVYLYTADQMRAYVDADRAQRASLAAQPSPPLGSLALTELVAKWRDAAEHLGLAGLASLADCADELEAAMQAAPTAHKLIGYLPAYELGRLHSGHDARLRSAKFGPSALDGDVPVYSDAAPTSGEEAAEPALTVHPDTQRLDYLDELNLRLNFQHGTSYGWELVLSPNIVRLMSGPASAGHVACIDMNDSKARGAKSCRDVIDAARTQGVSHE